jgi:hypothetical protein
MKKLKWKASTHWKELAELMVDADVRGIADGRHIGPQ